ncbi:MAG TPA: inositol monophosphatase [Chloroflexi bacterium]|nr:inositol monophosphatase [Chloroflexota bacterium]
MLELAIRAAREAGQVLLERYGRPHEINVKGFRDISTEADLAAEETVFRVIREGCPGAEFVGEESSDGEYPDYGDAPTWYVDPLDGTTNFAHGMPTFSVSIAMARNGEVQCGVVYDPLLNHMFHTARGEGAFLNGRRLHVSDCDDLGDAVVMLDWPREQTLREQSARYLARLAARVDTVRSQGSAALGFCYVAAGWADAYFQYTLCPWDAAAGLLLVQEAGGRVTGLRGQPFTLHQPDWLATNGLIHEAMLAIGPHR